jgi:lipoate-protein ligase A
VTLDETKCAFKAGFEEGLNINLEPYQLTKDEMDYVMEIAKSRYENNDWNFMR